MSKIVRLSAENVKRLSAVEIRPDGATVVVGGRNGQGKSSVLDSIQYALGDKGKQCSEPVRRGKDKARVVLELDDGLVVTRTMTKEGGGTLKVTAKDGAAYPSPQAMLDKLVGRLTFDPLAFMRLRPRDQADAVKGLVGVDTDELDAERARLYSERTEAGHELKSWQSHLASAPPHEGVPDAEVSVAGLVARLNAASAANAKADEARRATSSADEALRRARSDVMVAESKLNAARAALEKAEDRRREAEALAASLPREDTNDIEDSISQAEVTNRKVRENASRRDMERGHEAATERVDSLTERILDIDRRKAAMVAEAKFPVKGLGFGADGLTLDGLPLDQASSAEQLRVSVAMGLSLNPKLKVLLIRDGSLLDADSLRMVAEMAEGAEAQVWIERVGDGEECSVVIEDGMLSGTSVGDGVEQGVDEPS